MTETLAGKTCVPCRGGIPPLTRDEAQRLQAQAPDWQLADDAPRIERTFQFRNFRESLAFVQEVGELAETEGHHPDISFGWGYATVSLALRRSRDCTRTISSWRPRSTEPSIARVGPLTTSSETRQSIANQARSSMPHILRSLKMTRRPVIDVHSS